MKNKLILSLLVFGLAACSKPGANSKENLNRALAGGISSQNGTVAVDLPNILGPQVVIVDQANTFTLQIPQAMSIRSASWDFGDGSGFVSQSLRSVNYTYSFSGIYNLVVTIVDGSGNTSQVTQSVSVLPLLDGPACSLTDLGIQGPTAVVVGVAGNYSLNIPACFASRVTNVSWDLGDGTKVTDVTSLEHLFVNEGSYLLEVLIYSGSTTVPVIRLNLQVNAVPAPVATPTPTPNPDPTPAPSPEPVDLCSPAGIEKKTNLNVVTETAACGLDGQKTMTYQVVQTDKCQMNGDHLDWISAGQNRTLISEGSCLGQSCSGFGADGSVKTGVIVGEISEAVQCPFGETGITNIFNQVSDQTCVNGTIKTSNIRKSDLKTAGICPVYSWVGSEQYSACSADCGGTQNQIFECRSSEGLLVSSDRCASKVQPAVSRVCDGNPQAVSSMTAVKKTEEAPSCATCPKNQIGVVVTQREVTTTTSVACVDHQIKSTVTVTTSPWVKESYCKDFVAHRCSQDSLSNARAHGRYDWMVKCQAQIPAVKEFLDEFNGVKKTGYGLNSGKRFLYPTFMDTKTKAPWIAPTHKEEACQAPASAYVAAVCVSSCATPDEEILAQGRDEKRAHGVSFIEALEQNYPKVATMMPSSSIRSRELQKTKVDQWVTEMMDTDHVMIQFRMKSGGSLKLTLNHPVLSEDGSMKLAQDFKVGDRLVQLGGKLDEILSLEESVYHGKVYNLFVKSDNLKKNIVVTNGYLNGTAFFQNEGAVNMNRNMFRKQMIRGVFDK